MVPKEHVTDASQVKVLRLKVVEVISVGLKLQGRRAVLNNGSDRKVRKALAKYGSDARYHLGDMLFPEVTISVPIDSVLLSEWKVQDVEAHTVGG